MYTSETEEKPQTESEELPDDLERQRAEFEQFLYDSDMDFLLI